MLFQRQLTDLLNRYSKENVSDTPDWILAQYLLDCLTAFNTAVQQREQFYGRGTRSPKGDDDSANTEEES